MNSNSKLSVPTTGWIHGLKNRSRFSKVGNQEILLSRTIDFKETVNTHIAYTSGWCLIHNFTPARATILNQSHRLEISEPGVIFIPPWSILEWNFLPGKGRYDLYYELSTPPANVPFSSYQPMYYPNTSLGFDPGAPEAQHKKREYIIEFFNNNKGVRCPALLPQCSVSTRVQKALIQSFDHHESMEQVAKRININPSMMSRAFKKSFGISPVHYRSLLRVMRAQELLLIKCHTATQTAYESGFQGFSQFFKQFKRYLGFNPSNYKMPLQG